MWGINNIGGEGEWIKIKLVWVLRAQAFGNAIILCRIWHLGKEAKEGKDKGTNYEFSKPHSLPFCTFCMWKINSAHLLCERRKDQKIVPFYLIIICWISYGSAPSPISKAGHWPFWHLFAWNFVKRLPSRPNQLSRPPKYVGRREEKSGWWSFSSFCAHK